MAVATIEDLGVLYRELELRDRLSEDERLALANSVSEIKMVPAGVDIVRQGDRTNVSTLLLSGMVTRYAQLNDGQRQITALHVPGDFVDLHSFPLKLMDHSVATLVPSRFAYFPHAALERITEQYPHLTRLLWMLTLIDGARHRQWLAAMGALPALERTAHIICELAMRLSYDGIHPPKSFLLPLTQTELSEMLGLSLVHTNRTIQTLRARELLQWDHDTDKLTILDWTRLVALGKFEPGFLHFEKIPR